MKIEFRDCIGAVTLLICLYFIGKGVNHTFTGIAIMVVTYYFRKRQEDIPNGKRTSTGNSTRVRSGAKK